MLTNHHLQIFFILIVWEKFGSKRKINSKICHRVSEKKRNDLYIGISVIA